MQRTPVFIGALVLLLPALAAATQHLAIPSYFSPGALWTQMEDASPTVGLAIINPDSGPGAVQDPSYVAQVNSTKAKGILVLGYVYTSYATRSAAAVQADIDLYYVWYGVDGIFLDEASTDCADQPYYAGLDAYVKAKGGIGKTVINPGTTTPECYITAADIILNFESSYAAYQAWTPSGWEAGYDPSHFWHLVYGTSEANMPSAVLLSQSRGAGWIYVTPDSLPNPWDTLPADPYWSTELTYVQAAGGCTPVVRPKVQIAHLGTPPGDDRLSFSGQTTLPGAPRLDPPTTGVRLLIDDTAGNVLDVTIPSGAYPGLSASGWTVNRRGTTWTYIDRSDVPAGGIRKVKIQDRSAHTPGLVTISVRGADGAYTVPAADLPISATLLFDPGDAAGPCTRASFPGPDPVCAFNANASTLTCR